MKTNIATKQIINIAIVLIILLLPTLVHAQAPADPGGDVDAPIDGGLSLLIAGGIGYGAKKLKAKRN